MTSPQDPFSTPPQGGGSSSPRDGDGAPPPAPYGGAPGGYGAPASEPRPYGAPAGAHGGSPKNGFGIAALVLGILGLLSWFFLIGGLFGLVAVVLGFLGRGRAKRGEATNGGVALAGIITGALAVLLTILVGVGVASLFKRGGVGDFADCVQQAGQDQAAIDACEQEFRERIER